MRRPGASGTVLPQKNKFIRGTNVIPLKFLSGITLVQEFWG